jgi:hypothetical protein
MALMIRIGGFWAPAHPASEGSESYEDFHAYEMPDGKWYLMVGHYDHHSERHSRTGLYRTEEGGYTYIEWPEGQNGHEPTERGPLTREERIVNDSVRMMMLGPPDLSPPSQPQTGQPAKEADEDSPVLEFTADASDDPVVAMIKDAVNAHGLTLEEFYSHFDSRTSGYNMLYGLQTRPTITFKYLRKWADILDSDLEIKFARRKR